MEKLKMHTPDLTVQNIEKLAQLFPDCVTEARDDKGRLQEHHQDTCVSAMGQGHSLLYQADRG